MTEQIKAVENFLNDAFQRRAVYLRVGAACAVVGTLGYLVAFLLHGDLPDQTTESLLTFIADRPWALHHFLIICCFLLWLAALSGLAYSLTQAGAWVLGRLGQGAALLGMAVLLWHYNIDGPALEGVADAWVDAEGPQRAVLLERGTILADATTGMFPLYVALLLGLPFLLFGVALVIEKQYPGWLGWLAVVAGGLAFVVGASNFVGFTLLPMTLFVLTVFMLDFWMLAVARLMWRHGSEHFSVDSEQSMSAQKDR